MLPRGSIYVITGERGSGKSTVCARVALDAAGRGLTVAGIVTERSSPEQGAVRRVMDLRSGEVRLFGSQSLRGAASAGAGGRTGGETAADEAPGRKATSDPLTPGWQFDADIFAWGNEVFARSTPCDLLVIDELGPLELLGGRGWRTALAVLRSLDFRAALVVCRPGLLPELETFLGNPPTGVFQVDPQTRDSLPVTIVEGVLHAGAGA